MIRERIRFRAATAFLFALVFGTGCADSTMPEPRAADLAHVQLEETRPSNDYLLPPITVTVPQCDPWTDLNWCEGSGGGGDCMTGTIEDGMSLSSCPIGSGGGETGGGGAGGTGSEGDAEPAPFTEGPLLWGACVLAVSGAVISIDDVADKFADWWEAERAMRSARAALSFMYDSGYPYDPNALALAQYRLEQATQRRDDAAGAVRDATGVSFTALIAAGLSCGAAAFMPTP